jgi:hypothetical protein
MQGSIAIESLAKETQDWYESYLLASKNYWDMVWMLLTVCDDFIRLYRGATNQRNKVDIEIDFNNYESFMPYALKHALAYINKKLYGTKSVFRKMKLIDAKMKLAQDLIFRSIDYEKYWRCLTSVSAQTKSWSFSPEESHYHIQQEDQGSNVIYYATNLNSTDPSPFSYLKLLLLEGLPSGVPLEIMQRARKGAQYNIAYSYDNFLAKRLSEIVQKSNLELLGKWNFPWGTEQEAVSFQHALVTRCIYHFISINYGAISLSRIGKNLPGFGVGNLCMILKREAFIQDISALSGLSADRTDSITEALTYGNGLDNPDPALQPIFSPTDHLLLIPPIFASSVSITRNLLSLHSRVSPDSFNNQSNLFEKLMTERLLQQAPTGFIYKCGARVPNTKLEVDLIMADTHSKVLLIGELKWFNNPGDIREVIDKRKGIQKGVSQIYDRLRIIKEKKIEILRDILGIKISDEKIYEWDVHGVLVLEGYFDVPEHQHPQIAIIPSEIFLIGLQKLANLGSLFSWLIEKSWYPVQGVHYEKGIGEVKLDRYTFSWDTFAAKDGIANYLNFARDTTNHYQ